MKELLIQNGFSFVKDVKCGKCNSTHHQYVKVMHGKRYTIEIKSDGRRFKAYFNGQTYMGRNGPGQPGLAGFLTHHQLTKEYEQTA